MTPLNLSISSSDAAKYLGVIAGITLAMVALCASIVVMSDLLGGDPQEEDLVLLNYQIGKINSEPVPDTVFFGDSSCGNAISAVEWSRLSGKSTLNLALTGGFGYEGSYNMLRRLLERGKPNHVVIMQTSDMMLRDASNIGFRLTTPDEYVKLAETLRFALNLRRLQSSAQYLASYAVARIRGQRIEMLARRNTMIINDYIKQMPRNEPRMWAFNARFSVDNYLSRIRAEKTEYLKKIADLCHDNGLDCVYAHGPLIDPACSNAARYFDTVGKMISAQGIRLATPTSLCISVEEGGDGEDHANPANKSDVTRRYYDIIAPQLRK